jgi:hypothetical protein
VIDMTQLITRLTAAGFDDDITWAEDLRPPVCPEDFATETIFVICNSGMRYTTARTIYEKVIGALRIGHPVWDVFGHAGKAAAIETIWKDRARLFAEYKAAPDKLWYLETLPWIGGITKYHCAKNFGLQYAKPDVHLQRLAKTFKTTPQALCEDLAKTCGYKVATVDTLLWRAAAIGILDTRTGKIKEAA